MPTQGPFHAGIGSNVVAGGNAWASPNNIVTQTQTQCNIAGLGMSDLLKGTNYLFTIPLSAVISTILIEIFRQVPAGAFITDQSVRVLKAGSAVGSELAVGTAWPSVGAYQSYGGDLLGTTWLPADINNANFGAYIQAQNSSGSTKIAQVRDIRITVGYSISGFMGMNTTDA